MLDNIDKRIPNDALIDLARKQEQPFLCILLKDKDCLRDAIAYGIKPDHFWDQNCRFFFKIIEMNYKKNSSLLTRTSMDSIMDMAEMKGLNEEKRVVYKKYWDDTFYLDAPIDDFNLLKKAINDRYVQWQAYKHVEDYYQKLINNTNNQTDLVNEFKRELDKVDNIDPESYGRNVSLVDCLEEAIDYIDNKRDNPESQVGIMTGIVCLDELTLGLDRGSYTVITGQINGGKTTFMINLAFNMARAGHNVLYVSLEKKAITLALRLLCMHGFIDFNRIKRGGKGEKGLNDEVYKELKRAVQDLKDKNIRFNIIELPQGVKFSRTMSEINKVKSSSKTPIDVLVYDYLQAASFEINHPGRSDLDLHDGSKQLQSYGRINNFVTITAMQLTTSSSKDIRKRTKALGNGEESKGGSGGAIVNTEDVGGSRMIQSDADNTFGIVLDENDSPPTKAFITISKGREMPKGGTVCVDFNGAMGTIMDTEFHPSKLVDIDNLVYNKDITEEQLKADNDLFVSDVNNVIDKIDESKSKKSKKLDLDKPVEKQIDIDIIDDEKEEDTGKKYAGFETSSNKERTEDDIDELLFGGK